MYLACGQKVSDFAHFEGESYEVISRIIGRLKTHEMFKLTFTLANPYRGGGATMDNLAKISK